MTIIDMTPGPDGVFRQVKPGTAVARISTPTAIAKSGATRTAFGTAAKSFLGRAAAWVAGLSMPGKILLAGATLFGASKLLGNDAAPHAQQLAMQYPVV